MYMYTHVYELFTSKAIMYVQQISAVFEFSMLRPQTGRRDSRNCAIMCVLLQSDLARLEYW